MPTILRSAALLLVALLIAPASLTAHGFHGGYPDGVLHALPHALPLLLLAALMLVAARRLGAVRPPLRRRLNLAAAALAAFALLLPLLA